MFIQNYYFPWTKSTNCQSISIFSAYSCHFSTRVIAPPHITPHPTSRLYLPFEATILSTHQQFQSRKKINISIIKNNTSRNCARTHTHKMIVKKCKENMYPPNTTQIHSFIQAKYFSNFYFLSFFCLCDAYSFLLYLLEYTILVTKIK